MEDYTHDSAAYLLRIFLCSKYSLKYKLEPTHLSIIRYIGDSIDISFATTGKKSTLLSYNQIALYARCSRSTVDRCIIKIKKFHILRITPNKGWKTKFSIGLMLTAYAQKNRKLSPTHVTMKKNPRHSDVPSDSFSVLKTNNKGVSKNVKKIISVPNGHKALKELGDKLKLEGKI
jgi:hypothetical protein